MALEFLQSLPGYQQTLAALMQHTGQDQAGAEGTLQATWQNLGGAATPRRAWKRTAMGFGVPRRELRGKGMYAATGAPGAGAFQRAADQANIANQERYAQIKQGYADIFNKMQAEAEGLGDSARRRIADQYSAASGSALSNLTSRGLGNTTVAPAVERGLLADRQRSEADVDEALKQTRLGLYQVPLSSLMFQERRTDQGPDMGQFLQYAQMMGAAQGGQSSPWGQLLGAGAGAGLGALAGGPLGGFAGMSIGSSLGGMLDKIF